MTSELPLTPLTRRAPAPAGLAAAASPALEAALGAVASGSSALILGLPAGVVAEARAALAAAPVRPAGPRAILEWLRPVVAAVRNPPDRQRAEDFAAALAAACCDLPAELWTAEALRAGLREWKFWPAVAEVRAAVRAAAAPLLARRSGLRLLAAARALPEPEPRVPPTEEQKQAVAALVASLRHRARNTHGQEGGR